jgi:hypothetical protein
MTGQDVENFFLNNPPFEITDKVKYMEFLQFQSGMSMMELSDNDPIISEVTVPPVPPLVDDDETVLFDLKTLHNEFLDLIVFSKTADLVDFFSSSSMYQTGSSGFRYIGSAAVTSAMRSNSVINLVAINDYLPIIEEWFSTKREYIVIDNSFIKITPNTEYYALFRRYKSINELRASEIRIFKQLLSINIMLDIYQSDTFASEGGIRSVSLSGLSVSFNVPEATTKIKDLTRQKTDLLANIAMDYSDGCVGLI